MRYYTYYFIGLVRCILMGIKIFTMLWHYVVRFIMRGMLAAEARSENRKSKITGDCKYQPEKTKRALDTSTLAGKPGRNTIHGHTKKRPAVPTPRQN